MFSIFGKFSNESLLKRANIANVDWIFWQKYKTSRNSQRLLKVGQSGDISPNLVTLQWDRPPVIVCVRQSETVTSRKSRFTEIKQDDHIRRFLKVLSDQYSCSRYYTLSIAPIIFLYRTYDLLLIFYLSLGNSCSDTFEKVSRIFCRSRPLWHLPLGHIFCLLTLDYSIIMCLLPKTVVKIIKHIFL